MRSAARCIQPPGRRATCNGPRPGPQGEIALDRPLRRHSDTEPTPASPPPVIVGAQDLAEWLRRCRAHLLVVEPTLADDEAAEIADAIHAFERTRVMAPEAAVDFVARELRRQPLPRFERRATAWMTVL